MGIQLDWQVDSERSSRRATEDPNAKYDRRRRRRKLAFWATLLAIIVGGVISVVQWRLNQVDKRNEQDLRDTVNVEITALRIGDYDNFYSVQRSENKDWLQAQDALYAEYQQLKLRQQISPDYQILDIIIENNPPRARVLIEQEIDGETYRMAWFYWRYTDPTSNQNGWRHVPQDSEFWGETQTYSADDFRLTYAKLDEDLAKSLAPSMADWWQTGCQALGCAEDAMTLRVEIVPQTLAEPTWDENDPLHLLIPSPLWEKRAHWESILSPEMISHLRKMIAYRVIDTRMGILLDPIPYSDTVWLRDEIANWLIGQFSGGTEGGSAFITSLQTQYGADFPERMMVGFSPTAQINFLGTALGIALGDLDDTQVNGIMWNDFFQWRLRAEQVAQNGDPTSFRSFYDTNDATAMDIAQQRYETRPVGSPIPVVVSVIISRDEFSRRLALVTVLPDPQNTTLQETIQFRWTGETWKRIN